MRKISADYLYPLEGPPLRQGVVALDEKGVILSVFPDRASASDVEVFEGALCPGFINAHCHLELSHLKGLIAPGSGLVNFILELQSKRGAFKDKDEEVRQRILDGEREMIQEGIVAVGDISNTSLSFDCKSNGRLIYHTFIECFGFNPTRADLTYEAAVALKTIAVAAFGSPPSPGVSITPHAPYSVSEALFRRISQGEKKMLSIHNQENAAENRFYDDGRGDFNRLYETLGIDISGFDGYGKTSLAAYLPWLSDQKKLLVHNTFMQTSDFETIKNDSLVYVCLCPTANVTIENALPPVDWFMNVPDRVVLGTDSLASNTHLSILNEMKRLATAFPNLPLAMQLLWACTNGAAFFGWDHLGSLAPGKSPGINLIKNLDPQGNLTGHSVVQKLI